MFRPKQQFLRVEARVPKSEEMDRKLEEAGLDIMPYKAGKYRIRLTQGDLEKHENVVVELLKSGYDHQEL